MEFHGIEMAGPLNTDNIRALDGTLAVTIDDTTGKVNFQDDVDVAGLCDVQGNARVFQNLEVQGPLASFLQSISVGVNAAITGDLTVGVDASVGNDLGVTRFLTVGNRTETVNLRLTGGSPAAGLQVQAADASGNLEFGGLSSVPTGQSILFYTNDTVLGYTLETLIADDDVVYITKGTAAGGQAGGQPKPGSTWTQDHLHSVSGVSGWHNHQWYDEGGGRNTWMANGVTEQGFTHDSSGTGVVIEANDDEAFNKDGWTKRTNVTLTGSVGPPTPNTWRPKGHNFTLQTKN